MTVIRPRLGVNIDHVATVRQARGGVYPDPVAAAVLAELAGADQITVHLREDRRHVNDRDVRILRETVKTRLNLEMAATEEMLAIAIQTKPDLITLVPEKREEQTTEGGLDVASNVYDLTEYIKRLSESGAHISMFIDPDSNQVEASKSVGAEYVEFHTGEYCVSRNRFETVDAFEREVDVQFDRLERACSEAGAMGVRVAAGHGLNYENTARIAAIAEIEEFNIGHSIVSRAVLVGFERAVREMIAVLNHGRYKGA